MRNHSGRINLSPSHLGSFDCLISKTDESQPWIVFLHGYGASADDLAPLSDFLFLEQQFNWAFFQGNFKIPTGPHSTGYGWFPIDEKRLMQMSMTGKPVSVIGEEPSKEFLATSKQLTAVLNNLSDKIFLGGFSQGSMQALQVASQLNTAPLGLILLSSTLANKKQWTEDLPKINSVPYFQSHGRDDNVLSFADAKELNKLLSQSGLRGHFADFDGGHEIPMDILSQLNKWMKKKMPPQT